MKIKILSLLLILLFTFLSLHETLNMYFVGDDFGFVYKLQNQNLSFVWPQHQLVNMYRPLYNLFHTNPAGYFAAGFLFFVISAITFYFLATLVFSNKWHALIASLIYVTAPVGIESFTMMLLYLGTYYALTLFNLILIFFIKYLKTGKTFYNLLFIIVLSLSFETVTYRAFLFPIVIFLFGIFFWNKKIIGVKKYFASFIIIAILWAFFYLFRLYLLEVKGGAVVTNIDPNYVIKMINVYISRLNTFTLGNNFFDGIDKAFFNTIYENPIRVLFPFISTINIIFTITLGGKIIPALHIPFAIILTLFSIFIILKKKMLKKENILIYFASIAFIFGEVFAFYIYSPKIIMPVRDHYAAYALPGYALFITSLYILLMKILKKQEKIIYKFIPFLLIVIIMSINLYNVNNYLSIYNQRIYYVKHFFKQIKELLPTLPQNPIVYIQPTVHPDDNPAEARWRLYDIWHGGIHGANVLFGLYYNIDASQTIATPTWEVVLEAVKENPDRIDKVFSFDYDLNGLHPTTEKTRKTLKSLILQTENLSISDN